MSNIISNHNKRVMRNDVKDSNEQNNNIERNEEVMCNCRKKEECPLTGECLRKGVVYQASVEADNKIENYIGLTATTFKCRYNNHIASFRNESNRYATELSKYIWTLKDHNKKFELSRKIVNQAKPYSNFNKRCNLCTMEKFFIIYKPKMATLNNRCELVSKCRHSSKFLLINN